MALPQTVIESAPALGYEGQLATGGTHDTYPRKNKSGVSIPFGRFLIIDTGTAEAVKLPSSVNDVITGVSLYEPAIEQDANGLRQYADKSVIALVKRGAVIMIPEQDMVPGDAVFARVTVDGGDATKTPGRLRKDNAGGTTGTKQKTSLTLSGALDGGRERIQKLVLSADLVADDVVTGKIGGTAIASITYATSHAATMSQIIMALRAAAETAGVHVHDIILQGATSREIHIFSADVGPATAPLLDWLVTHNGAGAAVFASATGADVTAGKSPHELQARLHADTLYKAAWNGSHDDTVALFAEQLRADAQVGSVTITVVPGGDDLVLTIEAKNVGVNPIAVDQNQVNDGVTARTLVKDETVAVGAAAVAAKAIAVSQAEIMTAGLAGKPIWVRLNF